MHELSDITSWMFGAQERSYTYFMQNDYIKTRLKDYDGKNILFTDWITLDARKTEEIRIVNSLSDVLGKVGGM